MTDAPAYPSVFTRLIDPIIGKEGGYTNDPDDSGGETIWGITIADARAFGYQGAMRDMSRDQAVAIYWQRYWLQPAFDRLALIDTPIAGKLLDIGINCGPTVGGKFLQRALNVLNNRGAIYGGVTVDGAVGAISRAALTAFIGARGNDGRKVLLGMIVAQQSVKYIEIAEANPKDESFEYGWQINRAVGIAFVPA
jgi:lysozyme family protein